MRRLLLLLSALFGALSLFAQEPDERMLVRGGDTLRYTYTPQVAESQPLPEAERRSGWEKFIGYFERANQDRTLEKRFDVTFIGGPSYSSTNGVGLGVMAAGLYRTDRSDALTRPSDVTLFASVSTTGFYTIGLRGNTIFKHDKNRLNYKLQFWSKPLDFWGVGYDAGLYNPSVEYDEKYYRVEADYLHRLARSLYGGFQFGFHSVRGRNFEDPSYLGEMSDHYLYTGAGLLLEYDTRDFAPNPYKGIYAQLSTLFYPKFLGNCPANLWKVEFTLSGYQQLWKSGILAAELRGEFNSPETPWPFMARMGGNDRMRGYYEGRYTDRNLITAQVELRQRIWRRIGCTLWAGAGNPFPSFKAFRWDHTLPNYGLGLRWEFKKRVNIRIDYGFGKDTRGLVLQINEAF